ncbi:uncharacterized protein NECHADRAFT_73240 [Fusarium vanettenii 77-13-4]|uniref:C2H2-type domain-containing protein n=1 Tax=Fusarium vanettenii (strain ATCC MYA-4622 / CBS 123669 / FGSC 9596 / NRRL 45880 / 77-13-4) TaxID=660122 RepID=C7ZAS3_FUSV7|nr:uncharacterized protein NECHADRAFT_73240 [Fusarium vanettenii 77-13-4]EEU38894.1 hypothetical protein NECHADRAFT_73240 [Fusarium vanettenii 77-13-4]
MPPTNQPARTMKLSPFKAHGEGDTLTPSEEYTQLGLARDLDTMNQATQDSFPCLQQDGGESRDQTLLSWHPQDLADVTTGSSTSASVGNMIQPTGQPWQASLSSWPLHGPAQDLWQHPYQTGLGEVLSPTWELSQGTARALQHSPIIQTQPQSLPRRRSRYFCTPALPMVSRPIDTPGPSASVEEGEMNPIQRWRNSPPETEPASLSAIADALRNAPLRGQASTSSLNSRRSDIRAGSTVSFASGSSLSSGSASASSMTRRSRVLKRTRPTTKGKTAEKRRFPCTFCCDSFKSKFDWARHERSLHLNIEGWRCAPFGSIEISAITGSSSCAYCGLVDPSPAHLEDHDINLCRAGQIYARKDHLAQHLRCIHHVKDPPSIDSWKVEGPPITSRCGFCDLRMETWQERIDHLVSHFRKGKTMDDWKGDHDLEPKIAALVTNAIPPYLIASEANTYAPFSATTPNLAHAEHLKQINQSAEQSFEAWSGSEPSPGGSGAPAISLHNKSFPELLAFHLGRFAQHQASLGVTLTDKMFQDEARRLQFGSVDPLDNTVADNEEWLSLFRSQHLEDSSRQSG